MHVGQEEDKPDVFSGRSFGLAVAAHVGTFLFFLLLSIPLRTPPPVTAIEMTVVVNENLDGNEDEPPPLDDPPPPVQPAPKPPDPEPEPPKIEDDPKIEALETVKEKKKPEKKVEKKEEPKKEEKKPEEKKPEKPKETLQERLERMRKSSTSVKAVKIRVPNMDSGNGRTAKKTLSDAEVMRLLNQGYTPGKTEQLAANEEQRCISLIRKAFYDKWESPPWNDTLKEMYLSVRFDANGRVLAYSLVSSSGNAAADRSVREAASRVGTVYGLNPEFLRKNNYEVKVRFTVSGR